MWSSIIPLSVSDDVRAGRTVDRCPVCKGGDFYRRKDFDQKRGVTVVVITGLISAGFLYVGLVLWAFGVLAAAAMIDLIVSRRIGDLTVCYRCHTEFRGDYPRIAPDFDLHMADVLELEWSRELEKRASGRTSRPLLQNSFTTTISPFSTMSVWGGISMNPSARDMLVMSPDALNADTASPSTTRTV